MERRHVRAGRGNRCPAAGEIPVYAAGGSLLEGLTGYRLTRGVSVPCAASAARRGRGVLKNGDSCLENIVDATNIGAIFPLCRCAGYGCSPGDPRLLRSVEQARRKSAWALFSKCPDLYRQ